MSFGFDFILLIIEEKEGRHTKRSVSLGVTQTHTKKDTQYHTHYHMHR